MEGIAIVKIFRGQPDSTHGLKRNENRSGQCLFYSSVYDVQERKGKEKRYIQCMYKQSKLIRRIE